MATDAVGGALRQRRAHILGIHEAFAIHREKRYFHSAPLQLLTRVQNRVVFDGGCNDVFAFAGGCADSAKPSGTKMVAAMMPGSATGMKILVRS